MRTRQKKGGTEQNLVCKRNWYILPWRGSNKESRKLSEVNKGNKEELRKIVVDLAKNYYSEQVVSGGSGCILIRHQFVVKSSEWGTAKSRLRQMSKEKDAFYAELHNKIAWIHLR